MEDDQHHHHQDEHLDENDPRIVSTLAMQRILLIAVFGLSSIIYGSKVSAEDFTKCVKKPAGMGLAMMVSVLLAPLVAYVVTLIMPLNSEQGITLLVISCCPAGALSPTFAFYTRSDVCLCLSVMVLSVLMSVGMIPLGVFLCSSAYRELDLTNLPNTTIVILMGMMIGCLGIGMTFRNFTEKWSNRFVMVCSPLPVVVTLLTILIVGIAIPHSLHMEWFDIVSVLIYFLVTMALTYLLGLLAGQKHGTCRAMAFCAPNKNITLALTMIHASFAGDVLLRQMPVPTSFLLAYIGIGVILSLAWRVYSYYVPEAYMDD